MQNPTLNDYRLLLSAHLPDSLIVECYDSILKNDDAHNVDHVYRVCDYGLKITLGQLSRFDISMVLAGCLMHDLGCRYDRKTHHQISYGLAFEKLHRHNGDYFSEEEIRIIALSCLEHRASWKELRSHYICDYVAVADRGPLELHELIMRCIQFRAPEAKCVVQLKQEVFDHLREKCSRNGYMWKTYPTLGFRINQLTIENIIERVENDGWLTREINEIHDEYLKMREEQNA
jgi:hypothetical protein